MITINLTTLLHALLTIAGIVLLVFLIVAVANLIKVLKKLFVVLDDASTVTAIIDEKAKETKPVVDDITAALVELSSAFKGKEPVLQSLSSIAKAVSSLVSVLRQSYRSKNDC
jgi:uncharacterized protein YoxC